MRKIASLAVSIIMLGSSFMVRAEGGSTPPPPIPPLNDQVKACIVAAIGQDRFTVISTDTTQATEAEKEAIHHCFSDDTGDGQEEHPVMSVDLQNCLIAAIGQDRFTAISTGASEPTDAEEQAGHACFAQFGQKPPTINTSAGIPDSVEQCMKLAVGEDRFSALKDGKILPTLDDRDAAQKCFGAPAGPMSPEIKPAIGFKLKACLIGVVGQARFDAISSGQSEPTTAERTAAAACFTKNQDVNANEGILPPPTQEVPFLPRGPKTVNISGSNVKKVNGKPTLTVTGTGKPGEAVDVHLFSKGTTVTVQVGKNGKWSYTFNRSLPKGSHKVYATARTGKKTVRSASSNITVR